jgi:hypothetical protein
MVLNSNVFKQSASPVRPIRRQRAPPTIECRRELDSGCWKVIPGAYNGGICWTAVLASTKKKGEQEDEGQAQDICVYLGSIAAHWLLGTLYIRYLLIAAAIGAELLQLT